MHRDGGGFQSLAGGGECERTTASRGRGLEDGYTQGFLPIWTEKDFGKWTTNIGGGYDINPGKENRNWWLMGAMLQRRITDQVAVGAEVFHQTVQVRGGKSETHLNPGVIWGPERLGAPAPFRGSHGARQQRLAGLRGRAVYLRTESGQRGSCQVTRV